MGVTMEIFIIIAGIFLDRITKLWAIGLKGKDEITIIKDLFAFEYLENRGAAFGIFQGKTFFLVIFTIIVLAIMVYMILKYMKKSRFMAIALSLIISGAVGNLYDRVIYNYVVDFILVHYKDMYYFPTFNVADILVCIGTFLLCIAILKEGNDE